MIGYQHFLYAESHRPLSCFFELDLADYTTSFGLLALEELLKDWKENGGIKVCAYRTVLFGKQQYEV